MQEPEVSLQTICKGAIPEVFRRHLLALVSNIKDVNTKAEGKRTITIEISFEPFRDRSGWLDSFEMKSKLGAIHTAEIQGSAFITQQDGEWKVFPHDPKQQNLFASQATGMPQQ
jgi:hypothetical protein